MACRQQERCRADRGAEQQASIGDAVQRRAKLRTKQVTACALIVYEWAEPMASKWQLRNGEQQSATAVWAAIHGQNARWQFRTGRICFSCSPQQYT